VFHWALSHLDFAQKSACWTGSKVTHPLSDLIFISCIFLSDRRLAGKENAGKENKRLYGRRIFEAVH
jgi:hypothetical protein